jgi:DNA invertase Pin-like site-specific DNA recombinase
MFFGTPSKTGKGGPHVNFAYKRVSTEKQDLRRQEEAFKGLIIDREYCDKLSGGKADRPQLNKLRQDVREGDNIYVESISRLGRNVDDLRLIVREFKDKGVTVHFIKEGFNTGNNNNMFKFMLTILGAVAEMERELTVERIREGVAKAKRYGTRSGRPIGRPPLKIPHNFKKYYAMWKAEEITATDFAKLLEVSRSTLYRYIRESEAAKPR